MTETEHDKDDDIRRLLEKGLSYSTIAKTLHVSKGRVSAVKNVPSADPPRKPRTGTRTGKTRPGPQKVANLADPDLDFLYKEIAELKKLALGKFVEDLKGLRKAITAEDDILRYQTPPMLYDWQREIIEAILDPAIRFIAVQGEPRVGKSTGCWMGIVESIVGKTRLHWDMMGSKGGDRKKGGCRRILADLVTTDVTAPLTQHVCPVIINGYIGLVHGGYLACHDTTVDDIKGITTDGLWITEFDQVLKENPLVLGAALTRGRSNPNMKIIFDCNRPAGDDPGDTAVFNYFLKTLEPLVAKGTAKVFIIEKKTCTVTHIDEAQDEDLRVVIDGTIGSAYSKSQLDNEDPHENDLWNPNALLDAYEGYHAFIATNHDKPVQCKMGIDPGYNGLAIIVVARHRSGMIQVLHNETASGALMTEQQLLDHVVQLCEDYGVDEILTENNSGALWWADYWRSQHLRVSISDFGAEDATNSKGSFLRVFKAILDRREIVFGSDELRRMIAFYNPDQPRGKDSKHKAHQVDALLHPCFKLVGGLKYLRPPSQDALVNRSMYRRH